MKDCHRVRCVSWRLGHCQTEQESQRPQWWSSLMRVVSDEVIVLLDHESAAHIPGVVTSPFPCDDPSLHASELLHSSMCHFVKRKKFACLLAVHWTR